MSIWKTTSIWWSFFLHTWSEKHFLIVLKTLLGTDLGTPWLGLSQANPSQRDFDSSQAKPENPWLDNYVKFFWLDFFVKFYDDNPCEHRKKSSAKAPEPQLWLYFKRLLRKNYFGSTLICEIDYLRMNVYFVKNCLNFEKKISQLS
jgi:hypothetical protein